MDAMSRLSGLKDASSRQRAEPAADSASNDVHELLVGTVEAAVGPTLVGSVIHVSTYTGVAVVREERSRRRYKVSRDAVDSAVFDSLHKGSMVRFRDNGHNVVAALSITAPR